MIIKEFRIPLPMSLEQYRVGREYCIYKAALNRKQLNEAECEVIEPGNEYTTPDGTQGIYRKHKHKIGSALPVLLKSFISSKEEIIEEVWDEYPFIRSTFSCTLFKNLKIDSLTYYKGDTGKNDGVFSEYKNSYTELDYEMIDILMHEPKPGIRKQLSEFIPSNGNKPLTSDWLTDIDNGMSNYSTTMCTYKLMTVVFEYGWFQLKI